ncbi:hypothetical protein EVAR_51515_1 [Eumeta japonica]|uniref:Uncharacterized protein n=1 Tax=Eumeta variegata TaxID=151549 RepID=A0A4C1XDB2_EUMVA|nr:hypothetical protein EVAR_51515_1 [Eumeta japonica]
MSLGSPAPARADPHRHAFAVNSSTGSALQILFEAPCYDCIVRRPIKGARAAADSEPSATSLTSGRALPCGGY